MTQTVDDGGYAFPSPADEKAGWHSESGMTMRDWFAGQALACIPLRSWDHVGADDISRIEAWAKCAYLAADAMLVARKGEE